VDQGQTPQEFQLTGLELHERPVECRLGIGVQMARKAGTAQGVMIAQNRDGLSGVHQRHAAVQHRFRVGAVADQVAQQHEPRRAVGACMREDSLEGFDIAVDIGNQRVAHGRRVPGGETRLSPINGRRGARVQSTFDPGRGRDAIPAGRAPIIAASHGA
jgi:hypothetical protein